MSGKRRKAKQKLVPDGAVCCDREVRGKHVHSIYVSAVDEFNVVNIDFTDGTALTVQIVPAARLKVEFNDWSGGNSKILKKWPEIDTQ